MKKLTFKQKLIQLGRKEKYDEMLLLINSTPSFYHDASILVMKAVAIQLGDTKHYTLRHAEQALLKAIKIDPIHVDACYELGFFYQNVMDNNKKAKKYFKMGKERLHNFNMYYKHINLFKKD